MKSIIPVEQIERRIYLIRGNKVMLDADLAALYGVTTKRLNEQVKRNHGRFPEDFMFQLTPDEAEPLRSQIATSNKGRGGRRYSPYVFTEYGAVMLSSVLNTPVAIETSVKIARAFVRLREMISTHKFSRKQVLDVRVIDLNAVVASTERLLCRLIGEDIELSIVAGKNAGRIKADQGQVEQVIMNLAVNARDAMPNGGQLKIETSNVDLDETSSDGQFEIKPGPYVMLSISDTGCGMGQDVLSHLFEPFFTTKERGKGTGLGLSTVYGIVKQSTAYIWVDSAPGRGTRFRICFPLVTEAAEPSVSTERVVKSMRGSETILLVEDDERVRSLIRRILAQQGYEILPAASGAEALSLCRQHKGEIHLLVTDVVMPQMSGGVLARQILETRPGMKVLYLSGYTDDVIAHQGVLKLGIHFLQKPFTPEGLARKAREVLEAKDRKHS